MREIMSQQKFGDDVLSAIEDLGDRDLAELVRVAAERHISRVGDRGSHG